MDDSSGWTARPFAIGRGARGASTAPARLALALLLGFAPLGPTACAKTADAPLAAPAPRTAGGRDARILDLEAAIEVEEEALRVLISTEPDEGEGPLHTSDEMRGIANRLPALQDELRGLLRAREIAAAREERARELQRDPQGP